jgi:hypothetical protein
MEIMDSSMLMNEDDFKELEKLKKIKKQIMALFNDGILVEKLKELVNNSELVLFVSSREEKFLDKKFPVLKLKFNRSKIDKEFPKRNIKNDEEQCLFLSGIIFNEIITPFNTYLWDIIKQSADTKIKEEYFIDNFEDDEVSKDFLTSMFGMKYDLQKLTVNIEYFR